MSVIGSDSLKMTAPICQSVTHLKVICTARKKNPRILIFTENYLYQLQTDNRTQIVENWTNIRPWSQNELAIFAQEDKLSNGTLILKFSVFHVRKESIEWLVSLDMLKNNLNHKPWSKSNLFLETCCFIPQCFSCFLFGIYKGNILLHSQATCLKKT